MVGSCSGTVAAMSPQDTASRVLEVVPQPLPYYTLRLRATPELAAAAPGQFAMLAADSTLEPYLRRAFSVFDVGRDEEGPWIEILGKIIGVGTRALAHSTPGFAMPTLGPLGRGFHMVEEGPVGLVAGGVGSAALLLLAQQLAAKGVELDVLYGGRSSVDLACADRFQQAVKASGGRYVATTEDGSAGTKGLITEPLEDGLRQGRYRFLYTCGPHGLMRRVAELGMQYQVPGEAALETPMGCGYGACLGCAVPRPSGGYALCCKDGPIFGFDEVAW